MTMPRKLLASLVVSAVSMAVSAAAASAQTIVDPQVVPERNDGGWIYWIAIVLGLLGVLIVVFLTIQYMRYAPRFSKDEEGLKLVRADRVRIGQELPRRNVDLSQAAPVVVAPPAVPTAAPALAAAPAAAPAAAVETATPAAPASAAPAAAEEAPAPATAEAEAPAPAPAEAPAPAPQERVEVTMDQEAYEASLKELLDAGTDRRIAEGKARRAGMIAARKKATGEA
jgi:hypothetical protein